MKINIQNLWVIQKFYLLINNISSKQESHNKIDEIDNKDSVNWEEAQEQENQAPKNNESDSFRDEVNLKIKENKVKSELTEDWDELSKPNIKVTQIPTEDVS